jgi:asparagine synthase (glutamine-hydrolysing)
MAASLEVRVPMLDDAVVRFADRLPGRALTSSRWGKLPLRQVLDRVMPGGPAWHKKRGFALPLEPWLRAEPTGERFRQILGDHAESIEQLCGVNPIAEWDQFRNNRGALSGGTSAMRLMWLATVGLWSRRFAVEPVFATQDTIDEAIA